VGSGNDPIFDGANIASRGDVVVVTINYRLETFGFAVFDDGVSNGNYGIADQITALEWVRDNIRDFGGDPSRVTIFGQSAGATSIRALLSSSKSGGLFVGAIPHSNLGGGLDGTHYSQYASLASVYPTTTKVLTETNCTNATSPVDCVRAVPAYTLQDISTGEASVVVDGTYIITDSIILNGTGPDLTNVHFLSGNMRDDGAAVAVYTGTTNLTASEVAAGFNLADINSELFPSPGGSNESLNVWNTTARIETDYVFRCVDQATVYAGVVNKIFAEDQYYYEANRSYQYLSYQPNPPLCDAPITPTHPFGDPNLEYYKCHAGDLINVFGTGLRTALPMRDELDQPFQQWMIDSWTRFARSWNPNPPAQLLQVRGYTNTTKEIALAGTWKPVTKDSLTMRSLNWPTNQIPFRDVEQCAALGYPIDLFV
jgi:carboxylesterase type B